MRRTNKDLGFEVKEGDAQVAGHRSAAGKVSLGADAGGASVGRRKGKCLLVRRQSPGYSGQGKLEERWVPTRV